MFDIDQLGAAPLVPFEGEAFRQQAPAHDPRSGEGARLRGGRYNPPRSFPTLYLCRTRACAVAELRRQGERQPIGLEGLLPRTLFRYSIELDGVLDLTDDSVRDRLRVTGDDLVARDWKATQELGVAAHHLGCRALIAPSATGVDSVLVVFVENIGLGVVDPTAVEHWERAEDL